MQITVGRILSLLIAGVFAIFAIIDGGFAGLKGCIALLLPLALIWFPDEIGSATSYFAGHMMRVDAETPPILISVLGWFFLIGLPAILYTGE